MENPSVVHPGGSGTVQPCGETYWDGCGGVEDSGSGPVPRRGESHTMTPIARIATATAAIPAPRRERCGSGIGCTGAMLDRVPAVGHRSVAQRFQQILQVTHRHRPPAARGAAACLCSDAHEPSPGSRRSSSPPRPPIGRRSRAAPPPSAGSAKAARAPRSRARSSLGARSRGRPASGSVLRRSFRSPAATRNATRQIQRAGSRSSSPRASACANASDIASSATTGSPVKARSARQIAGPSCR